MKDLDNIVSLIKEIDECLDKYDFKGYTFEEYEKAIKEGKKGTKGLRSLIKYNSSGLYIWSIWMQDCLDNCKTYINKIWLANKNKLRLMDVSTQYKYDITTDDLNKIKILVKRIRETRSAFKKNTDDFSIYPIESEKIGSNLTDIANYFEKYINMNNER